MCFSGEKVRKYWIKLEKTGEFHQKFFLAIKCRFAYTQNMWWGKVVPSREKWC